MTKLTLIDDKAESKKENGEKKNNEFTVLVLLLVCIIGLMIYQNFIHGND